MTSGNRIVWLTLHPSRVRAEQKFELEFKRSLFAASLSFTALFVDDPVGGPQLVVSGDARVRLPLKGELNFSSEVISGFEVSAVAFSSYTEIDHTAKRTRLWRPAPNGLELISRSSGSPTEVMTQIKASSPYAPILSPLQVVSALQSSWTSDATHYRGFVVAGTRIYALRLHIIKRMGTTVTLKGAARAANELLETSDWESVSWRNATVFEIDWKPSSGKPQSLRFEVPVVGKLELGVKR